MRQPVVVYALITAVLAAALGLTYYGYRFSSEVSEDEQAINFGTMRELAEEKVIGVQTEITQADGEMFDQVDPDNLPKIFDYLQTAPFTSVLVLGLDKTVLPSGYYTKRQGDAETLAFKNLFLSRVVPALGLDRVGVGEIRHLHRSFDGLPYLFSCTRRLARGRSFYVVVEIDLAYLLDSVFPEFFNVRGNHLYQVVDQQGEFVYGYAFGEVSAGDVIEVPFGETLSQWRLRVAPRVAGALASSESRQETVHFVLVGLSLVVILAGLGAMMIAVRRERRVSELKSEFISNVSHELKTPLSIISMFGELLALGRTKSPEQAQEYADIILRESNRLSRLIDSVLDFAKIERGVDVYEFAADQDLREIVQRALESSRHRLERAGLTLEAELADDLPRLRLDGNAITLAVLNLVDNAIKYASEGGRLIVQLRRGDDGVELVVRDFGPGIPADEREAVFERFYRSRAVRLKPIRGSGIGLALVKHIAEAHGGEVEVTDGGGAGDGGAGPAGAPTGCRFRLWIPTSAGA